MELEIGAGIAPSRSNPGSRVAQRPRNRRAFHREGGFTLVELMAVVTIIGTIASIAVPKSHEVIERARVARAIGDIQAMSIDLETQDTLPDGLTFFGPVRLDPWGNPYQYNKFDPDKQVPKGARRDRFLVPINSTYDLYSTGKDGDSNPTLNAKVSQDDVIRANDGGFVGLASKY
jgi:general secretion pathway protein G